ncbi:MULTISPECIES: DUF721 domain-containing protein [Fusobacterium]|uniref:DUF721 domain-containing protein n=1 Tax=Fusobacterium TaxID=848 RepID=UPI0014776DB7|nr:MULTISPECIES: DUF721 domain-containing protein [Fusobacterium]NME36327.1 DUF721 domain-containing protein [Fusobacterium sp. FSA-380-WT-3A]
MRIVDMEGMIEEAMKKSKTLRIAILIGSWEEIVGKFYKVSEIIGFKDDVLYIKVESSSYLHYMNGKKVEYIEKINQFLGNEYIKNIVFKIGKINIEYKFQLEKIKKEFQETKDEKIIIPEKFEVENKSIEDSIKYLKRLSKNREKILLEKGYKKCNICGSIFLGSGNICDSCRGIPIQTVINKN